MFAILRSRWLSLWVALAVLTGTTVFLDVIPALAQDAPAAAESASSPAPAADPATPSPTAYFSGNPTPDPTGGGAGAGIVPATGGDPDPETLSKTDLYNRIAHNFFSINMVWTLITGFLVMFMQAGFCMVEVGLCRAKNAAHTASMNFMVYPLGCLAFFAYGFAIGWGNWWNAPVAPGWVSTLGPGTAVLNEGIGLEPGMTPEGKPDGTYKYGLMGTKGFFLNGLDDVSVMALFFFMMVFMDTTATIPTGAMAERWSWKNFCIYALWVALPYCFYANWVWGGGWLAQAGLNWGFGHGAVDFAGSGVVHAMGGVIGLAGALCIGPRRGKFRDGKPHPIPAHHVPMVIVGTFILAFGWFGFNPGSTLSGTDLRISFVVVNTMLAGIMGAIASMLTLYAKGLKPDPTMMCNGMLAGLVAITAPCAFVDAWAAVVIGAVAGVLVVLSVFFWEKLKIDDPVGAISVHGVNGLWGVLSLGIFANGKYGGGWNKVDGPVAGIVAGDWGQIKAQALSCVVVVVFGFVMAYVWFKLSDMIFPIRVSEADEVEGLDRPEMGAHGYPEFTGN
ncbi:MAG: ammonium transporter [Planctomycetota bacterium]|nr:MAG: ammonium transporter [Planctomycetota bacterium]